MPYSDDELRARVAQLEHVVAELLGLLDANADGLDLSSTRLRRLQHELSLTSPVAGTGGAAASPTPDRAEG
jgi:hypothetical protein